MNSYIQILDKGVRNVGYIVFQINILAGVQTLVWESFENLGLQPTYLKSYSFSEK